MSTEVIVALISFLGVFISVLISLFASLRVTNTELQKLRVEIQKTYADKLIDKRLEIYPNIYFMLSNFMKKIEIGTVSTNELRTLHTEMSEWNSKHSILFSGYTGGISFRFRRMTTELLQKPDDELQKKFQSTDFLKELRHKVSEFELALKSDLGIYFVEFSGSADKFASYGELNEAVQKKRLLPKDKS